MKLPSLKYLMDAAQASFGRFPLPVICGMLGAFLSIYMVELEDSIDNFFPYINSLLIIALGIPLFFSINILQEKHLSSPIFRWLSYVIGFALLAAIYLSLPDRETTHNRSLPYIRYGIFNLIIHLVVSFVPYIRSKQLNGFWNYNKSLFIRILTAFVYSGFLYLGLVLALFALDTLFGLDIDEELYLETFFLVVGVFNTWFFLAAIPEDFDLLEEQYDYPKGLKVFTQYILLPLLILYLAILYAYGIKIITLWDWPKGIVSYLLSVVSVIGILTFLLIHPFGVQDGNDWIKKFSKTYYYLLFPLVIMLFIAIGMRVADYGMTINRYVIVLLGVWLTLVSIYFSFNKTNIKFIPVSLAVILGLMSFGPWGMFSYSEYSQVKRLKAILELNNLMMDGKAVYEPTIQLDKGYHLFVHDDSLNAPLNDSLNNEVYSILNYLDDHHGFSRIREYYDQRLDSLVLLSSDSNRYVNEAQVYMEGLGLDYRMRYPSNSHYFTFSSNRDSDVIDVSGYDFLINIDRINEYNQVKKQTFIIDGYEYSLSYACDECLGMKIIDNEKETDLPFDSLVSALIRSYGNADERGISPEEMILKATNRDFQYQFNVTYLNLKEENDSLSLSSADGYLLIKKLMR